VVAVAVVAQQVLSTLLHLLIITPQPLRTMDFGGDHLTHLPQRLLIHTTLTSVTQIKSRLMSLLHRDARPQSSGIVVEVERLDPQRRSPLVRQPQLHLQMQQHARRQM
jgi:hypothetical protein